MAATPNPALIVYGQYLASGITFAKANDNNLAVAKSINAAADSLTEVFNPVTLATGKITSASTGSAVVAGTGTLFNTDFVAGDYMFYYTANATPVLLGRVASVDGDTQITLTANATTSISAVPAYCGKTSTMVGVADQVIMRIPVVAKNITQIWLPNWNKYRLTAGQPTSYNDTAYSSMKTYSQVNNPVVIGSPVNVPYTITPIWDYAQTSDKEGKKYVFATTSLFPNYAYALLDPYGNAQAENLVPNTLFKMFANETFENNGILATTNYPVLFLQTAGY